MKKVIFLFALLPLLLFSIESQAQQFKTAIGARLGSPLSISFKTHLNESNAIEVIAGRRGYAGYGWWNVGAAYQIHKPLELGDIDGLQYYFGAGASAFFWNYDDFVFDGSTTTLGIQGYLGAQYTFADSRISLTVDWIPTFFVNSYITGFGGGYGGVGIRYVLKE